MVRPAPEPPSAPVPTPTAPVTSPTSPTTGTPGSTPSTPAPVTHSETTGGVAHTWTNYTNAGGNEGPAIPSNATAVSSRLSSLLDSKTGWVANYTPSSLAARPTQVALGATSLT